MDKTFEECLDELEGIVKKLESGEMALEESLDLFERGVAITKDCRNRLKTAERRIEIAREDAEGRLTVEPLDS
ncbi:MAG: exodeoxyribonuclease VII small subunit [Blastocatellia bacterium]|nr:exodeoxyribonuclease VII small subunit [Blastocatellia bacterium]